MMPEHRKELVQRRDRLKDSREQQWLESQRNDFLASLNEARVVYSTADDAPLLDWITCRFTVDSWSSIDWHDVKQSRCIASDISASPELLAGLSEEERLGDPDIAIVYADPAHPSLRMRYSELIKHANVILDSQWQTWAFDPASDWIIEFHHDLGWHWGKAE